VVEEAIKVTVGVAQVMFPPVADTCGGVMLQTTFLDAVAVQPFVVLVTRRV
jgi:hypothetical protein